MQNNICINKATKKDIAKICEIEKICFQEPYSFSQLNEDFVYSKNKFFVMLIDNTIIGYIYFSVVLDEAELLRIAILPQYRNKGYGTFLFNKSYEQLKDNINKIFLEVSENNIIAKLLYENQGFKEIYRRENYYKDGSCAIIMEKFI